MVHKTWQSFQLRDLVASLDGGVSVNGEDRVILLRIVIDVPDTVEQRAIAEERAWADRVMLLKAQMRALMSDLLTGKRRIQDSLTKVAA